MIRKLLVANRGEIAVRALRAATELDITTVAVYAYEDRHSLHRQKADESYEIGERGHPLRAYLDVDTIVGAAIACGADAIYPGYGFLSENPLLAEACEANGITFVGPNAAVLSLAGNKVRALEAATGAGLPTLRTAAPREDVDALLTAADEIGFPIFVKAAAGGGGRGLRRVDRRDDLRGAIETAMREAQTAFGDPTVFLEEAVVRPRHIEVQVLADAAGGVVHLYERDCSVQRRHQKVVEIAPAPHLDPDIRARMCADAVRFAETIGYRNAGTVEFLLDERGRYVFIEMNPRIQVEHTVTEEVTGVDLVQAQLRIASGATFEDLRLTQDAIRVQGAALQCRITTEDPAHEFRPDTGTVSAYRSPGGAGVRLDGGTFTGAEVLPYFDSMLVKLTCRGRSFADAVARARRAVTEFRIRGVATNIPFLQAVLDDPEFREGKVTTSFIDDRPDLVRARAGADRGTRLLAYLADVTVNRPHGVAPALATPRTKLPELPSGTGKSVPPGSRQKLLELGAKGFADALRAQTALAVTDTTFRDAHQSLLATRVRTYDLAAVAPHVARLTPQLLSVEAWGGATYDVALRFLTEDPWERLGTLRDAMPNLGIQMLLRGRNTVGYTPYPDKVCVRFVEEAARTGIDIFRIFDALNDIDAMRPAIEATLGTHAVAEGTLCYTGDLANPGEKLYTLDYYLRLAEQLVEAGVHVLCVKDMAGLLRAPAARALVGALRERFDLPVHLHTHDTAGGQLATYLAAIDAGVDAIDGASAALAGTTSQPPLSAIVAATDHTEQATGLSLDALCDLEPYWAAVREAYAPFESGLPAPTGRVYRHEIPGGQLSNLRQQAIALGLGHKFEEIEDAYTAANRILGNIVKVTPSSKVVGDLALHLSAVGADPAKFEEDPASFDIPDSVIGFLQGELGTPPGGWPEPFRTRALAGRSTTVSRTVALSEEQEAALDGEDVRGTLNRMLFPGPARDFEEARRLYGDVSVVPTRAFLHGLAPGEELTVELSPGVALYLAVEAIGEADERGYRTVYCRMNGQPRVLSVRDRSVKPARPESERADTDNPGHVPAPFSGVVTLQVGVGDTVEAGQAVATIEAMKMEASITASTGGTVQRVAIDKVASVEAGDLLAVIT
ncbi:pyruvate carboxylase [Yinghuangia sp. ASG 101]|uniref:pyruvate carboxylase n=1 Tax=Yinghuangia sp. ASG 101 TaxID=2896848 RepID=UPI001E4095FE|nr:pyruvate carboxylase [Yinghuangia sp. ASG 101]UGQ13668.1 pyruvate carboxylase [Yinghuangia sp. ASG 101]